MSDQNETYHEQIARLQREAYESQATALLNESERLRDEVVQAWNAAASAENEGDEGTKQYYQEQAIARTAEWQDVNARLPQPQGPRFTGEELDYMGRRPDLSQFQQTAAFYHEHITRNMGVPRFLPGVGEDGLPRSNPQYIELMAKVLEPANYEPPVASPDELIKTINETSRYGKDLTAREYNRNVGRLIEAKKRGQYSDR